MSSPFHSLLVKGFSLAYTIIPDDLQAEQLVIDSLMVLKLKSNDVLKFLKNSHSERIIFYEKIVELGCKRLGQLEKGIEFEGPFFRLSIGQRLALFLNTKWGLNDNNCAKILKVPLVEYLNTLITAKKNFKERMGSQ